MDFFADRLDLGIRFAFVKHCDITLCGDFIYLYMRRYDDSDRACDKNDERFTHLLLFL